MALPKYKEVSEAVESFEKWCTGTFKLYARCKTVSMEINHNGYIIVSNTGDKSSLYCGMDRTKAIETYIQNGGYHILE